MNDLISRESALLALKGIIARTGMYGVAVEVILANIPAVDAEPVVQAKWTFESLLQIAPICSNCGYMSIQRYPNCPYCRAHMTNGIVYGERKDNESDSCL